MQCWWKLFKRNCTKHCSYNEESEIIHKSKKNGKLMFLVVLSLPFLFLNFALEIKLSLPPKGKTQRFDAQGALMDCAGVSFSVSCVSHWMLVPPIHDHHISQSTEEEKTIAEFPVHLCFVWSDATIYPSSFSRECCLSRHLSLYSDFVLNDSARGAGLRHLTPWSSWSFRWQRRVWLVCIAEVTVTSFA